MSYWYEVFDNEEVQWKARQQATRLTAVTATVVLATLVLAALALEHALPLPLVGGLLVVLWLGTVRLAATWMRRLRRIVWCIKLSAERVVGYDYTRQQALLEWKTMQRVELADDGLLLIGPGGRSFEIPHLFPDFHTLSHRIVQYAEQHGVPVFLDGQPWETLDVYHLFPFLTDDASGTAA